MTLASDPGFPLLLGRLDGERLPTLGLYKDKCLQRRLAVRMRACGAPTLTDYVAVLDARPEEIDRLRQALTVNVTRFFRNPEVWQRLRTLLTPAWLSTRFSISAWSAGCASGEEAFTLAMLLAEAVAAMPERDRPAIRIDGTDIDLPCLESARRAVYPARVLADTPTALLDRWTEPAEGGFRMARELIGLTRFRCHDLSSPGASTPCHDIIACRNVLIYFERSAQARVLAGLASALRPGGLLLLGKVEMLTGPARSLLEPVDARERIFRRPG